jgi:hypothetical protein
LVLAVQFQNATLARYPEAVTELAVLALAYGVYGFFNANLGFVPQLANVFARSAFALEKTWRFVVLASVLVVLPLFALATTSIGSRFIAGVFSIDRALVERVSEYLVLMCPLIVLNGQRHFYTGLLVQARLTGWITILNFVYLATVIGGLLAGFAIGFKPAYVVVGAELIGNVVLIIGLLATRARLYRLPIAPAHEAVTYGELTRFFIPVSTTGVMFALSRPVLFAFVARTDGGILAIAALRVAFDFSMLFQQAANQFRHFFITFGFDDLRQKRRFMTFICLGLTGLMLAFVVTPLSTILWRNVMGLPEDLIGYALEATLIMCLMPAVIIYRNYFHGRLMTGRRTGGMAYGSMLRVAGIYVVALVAFGLDALDHITASFILILGFVIEALVAQWASRRVPDGQTS